MNDTYNEGRIELDENKLKRMVNKIYTLEKNHVKTGEPTQRQMKQEIEKIIEEEVKKCY